MTPAEVVLLDWRGVRGKITVVATCGVLAATGLPAAALAERGVTVDPQSPAGVEYAVPLDHARGGHGGGSGGSGSGGSTSGGSGGGSQALFGSGIAPASKASKAHAHSGGTGGRAAGGSQQKPRRGGSSPSQSVTPVAASASYSTTAPIAGLIGGILVAGGGFGLFLRRRRSSIGTP
jgi:hypothetical protein